MLPINANKLRILTELIRMKFCNNFLIAECSCYDYERHNQNNAYYLNCVSIEILAEKILIFAYVANLK